MPEIDLIKAPPQDLDAEQAVLGAVFLDSERLVEIKEFLSSDDFYKNAAYSLEINVKMDVPDNVTEEQLEYLRDIAERDAVNRFTTAEVKIDMTGMTNRIDGSADLDGVISQLTEGFTEALVTAAEGVHA